MGLPDPTPVPRSGDVVRDLCEIAVANVRRLDQIAEAMEKGLEGMSSSELSRIVRTIIVARTNAVKLATKAVGDLVGPLRAKNKAKDV